jgi:hypothetical protein
MDTVASTRHKEIARIQRTLERLHSPRLQMMLIVALTASVGFLASFALFHVGMDTLPLRGCARLRSVLVPFLVWLRPHPYHLALFHSGLSSSDRMDVHIEHMVAVLQPLLPRLKAIEDRCESVIHGTCVVRDEDGWELSPELLIRMGRLGIRFCFAFDEQTKENAA